MLKRTIAFVLALTLSVSCVPTTAFAAELEGTEEIMAEELEEATEETTLVGMEEELESIEETENVEAEVPVFLTEAGETPTATGSCGENIAWEYYAEGTTLKIKGSGEWTNSQNRSPFYTYRNVLTTVVIEGDITSIANYAFRDCKMLSQIELPDSVTSIGYYAFYNCTALTELQIPEAVTSIGNRAFYNNGIKEFVIPDGVTRIGNSAFEANSGMTGVISPDSVTSIGDSAFENCKSLDNVVIQMD